MTATRAPGAAIQFEIEGSVGRVTIERPPLNILDLESIRALRGALDAILADPATSLVETRGSATAFSAGVEIRDHLPESAPLMLAEFHALIRSVLGARVPVIAVVRGYCLGGGLELALASDFVLAADNSSFGQPEIRVGCFAPVASVLLPRLIPQKKAMEMLLTGDPIGAAEAERLGIVNYVAPAAALDALADKFRERLLRHSPTVLALARKAARLSTGTGIESVLRESERIYVEELLPVEDAREGIQAFLEKRAPEWNGLENSSIPEPKVREAS